MREFFEVMDMYYVLIVCGYIGDLFVKNCWTVHIKGAFAICKLYLNKVNFKKINYNTENDESEYVNINYYCSTKDTINKINRRMPSIRWVTDG